MILQVRAAAERLREHGLSVFPVRSDKRPATRTWTQFRERPPDYNEMHMFDRSNVAGVAVVCGNVSNRLRVRDFDTHESYSSWADGNPGLRWNLPTVETPRGNHVYYRADLPDRVVKMPPGELRGGAGYVVAPPSLHPSGKSYVWVTSPEQCGGIPWIDDPVSAGLAPSQAPAREPAAVSDPLPVHDGTQLVLCSSSAFQAVLLSLPAGPGQRNSKLGELARRLRVVPDLDDSEWSLRALVADWHRRALPFIGTKAFLESWTDFGSWWLSTKPLHGANFAAAASAARSGQLPPIPDRYESTHDRTLFALAWNLQRQAGTAPFFLACRKASEVMDTSRNTANRSLRRLVNDDVLQVSKLGKFKAGASEYLMPCAVA